MVIKLYISGISGNKEVKKKQQRVQMILDSKQINYEAIDITEPGKEKDKEFMQQNGKVRESLGKYPLPPQIFNDDDFCGDYEDFDLANEVDELEKFLHIETSSKDSESDAKKDESNSFYQKFKNMKQSASDSEFNPYEYHTFKIKFNGVNGLKEPIIKTHDLAEENEQNEDVKKSEVNGESEVSPSLEPSSESITKNVEISSDEVVAQEKEESSAQETKTNDETSEKEDGENAEDKQEGEGEADEKEEEKEEVENAEEETIEPNKENAPSEEEKEADNEDEEEEEEAEREKEENESENESPQSEKSED